MTLRRGKYNNVKIEIDGFKFDSKKEAKRYGELKLLVMGGEVFNLELQPKFPCVVNGVKVCTYIADFRYSARGGDVIEDVKGMKTRVYRLKKKLVEALYPSVKITEI